MDWAGFEEATKRLSTLGIAIQELAEAFRAALEWLADHFDPFQALAEQAYLIGRSIDGRKRRRKRFAEWCRSEDQRRMAKMKQYERVFTTPSGRRYFRIQRRACKPPGPLELRRERQWTKNGLLSS